MEKTRQTQCTTIFGRKDDVRSQGRTNISTDPRVEPRNSKWQTNMVTALPRKRLNCCKELRTGRKVGGDTLGKFYIQL